MKENCYNPFQNVCMPKNTNCPSDYPNTCLAANSLDAVNPFGCYDEKSTKKCLKKKAQIKRGRSKCSKPKVAAKCKKTCDLCGGVPPPSPAPPPVVG